MVRDILSMSASALESCRWSSDLSEASEEACFNAAAATPPLEGSGQLLVGSSSVGVIVGSLSEDFEFEGGDIEAPSGDRKDGD